ncbi:MAG: winged helix-turn-helix domain-containing protein, partial [Pseudomonadota bacterium]
SYHLERYGYIVNSVQTTEMLLNTIERIEPNMIILDEELPGIIKTINLCNMLKNNPKTKNTIIILATKKAPINTADINDYIIKPFVPSELVSKIKLLTTQPNEVNNSKKIISFNDIEMNLNTYRVTKNNKIIHLGPNEFKILQCFLELPGRVLSREHILNYVWGNTNQVEPRTIDVHINRLRNALKDDNNISLIRTIRSEGYSLTTQNELTNA